MPAEITPIGNAAVRPPVGFTLITGGVDVSQYVQGLRVNLPWNGRANLSVSLRKYSKTGDRPYLNVPPDSLGLRHHNRFAVDQNVLLGEQISDKAFAFKNVSGTVSLDIFSMGLHASSHMPVFLGGSWQDALLSGSWPCYDFTYFLETESQHMTDITAPASRTAGVRMAHEVSAEILRKYGIPSYDFRFRNHQIRQLRRSMGRPSDWLAKIRRVTQSSIRFRGTTAVIEPFRYRQGRVWPFKAGHNYSQFTWEEASQPPTNRFVITRVDPIKGRVGGAKCDGGRCPGRTVDFAINPPSGAIRTTVKVNPGGIKDWVFVGEDGIYRPGTTDGSYSGPPAVRCLATYEPTFELVTGYGAVIGGYESGYEINAYGADLVEDTTPYRKVFDDSSSHFGWSDTQAAYGVWQDYANLEDPIIAGAADLTAYGEAVLLESVRHCYAGILKTPFVNPLVEPGHWIYLYCPMSVMHGTYWFVEGVSFTLQEGTDWTMELAVSKGLW